MKSAVPGTSSHLLQPRDGHPAHRLPGLDGLRAVAVVAVILYHLDLPGVLPAGFLGVDIFFTLSGFIITALLLREHAREGRVDWLAFCGRRARRLMPPTLVMIAVAGPVTALFAPEALERLRSDLPAALLYLSNWWQIQSQQSYFETFGRPPVLQHLWSLAIEEQFYLLWPLVVGFVMHRRGRIALAATCALAALASTGWMAHLYQRVAEGGDPSRVYLGADTHVMGLFVGAALACLLDPWKATLAATARPQAKARREWLVRVGGMAALLAAIAAMQFLHEASSSLFQGGFLVLAAGMALLIAAALQADTALARGLRRAPVQWLGTRSFSLYLWHWPVVVWLWPAPGSSAAQAVINTLARLAITGVAAELSYRLVERGGLWRRLAGTAGLADRPAGPARPVWVRGAMAAGVAAGTLVLAYGVVPGDAAASANPPGLGGTAAHEPGADGTATSAAMPSVAATAVGTATAPTASAGIAAAMPFAGEGSLGVQATAKPPASTAASMSTSAPASAAASASASASMTAAPSPSPWPPVAIVNPAPPTDPTPPAPPAGPTTPAASGCVHIIGDSVVLGARPQLQRAIAGAVVDAEVGRQGHQAHQLLRQLIAERRLCPNVVLHIGTNGYLQEPRHLEMVAALAARGRVVLVNIRADRRWTAPNNDLIARAAREVPGVRVVDWSSASAGRPAYFVQDGIHLTVAGMGAFAEQIRTALAGAEPATEPAPLIAAATPQAGSAQSAAAPPAPPAALPSPSTSMPSLPPTPARPALQALEPITITPCARPAGPGTSCGSEVASR